jgi:hypothetical protein
MRIRATYLGLPVLLLGLACSTSGTHSRTARAGDTNRATQPAPGSAGTGMASGDLKGHASDHVISGRIANASDSSLVIESNTGERQTLSLVDQTVVTMDGRESSVSSLEAGQDVRASFNEQDGRNVAVKIEAQPKAGAGVYTPGSPPGTAPAEGSRNDAGMGGTTPAPSDTQH